MRCCATDLRSRRKLIIAPWSIILARSYVPRTNGSDGRWVASSAVSAYPTTDPDVRREMVETVRRWVAREVIPVALEMEHDDTYPEAIVEQMKAMGLFGITIPEE